MAPPSTPPTPRHGGLSDGRDPCARVHEPRRRHRRADLDVRVRLPTRDGRGDRRDDGRAARASCSGARPTRCSSPPGRPGPSRTTPARRSSTTRRSTSSPARSPRRPGGTRELVGPYDPDAIRRLKDEVDGDLYVSGSGTLVRALLADGLIDGLHLFVYPLTRGEGPRLFPEGAPRASCRWRRASRTTTASSTCTTGRRRDRGDGDTEGRALPAAVARRRRGGAERLDVRRRTESSSRTSEPSSRRRTTSSSAVAPTTTGSTTRRRLTSSRSRRSSTRRRSTSSPRRPSAGPMGEHGRRRPAARRLRHPT